MNDVKPWTEHGIPVTRTFTKVSVADEPDPITRAPAGYTTIAVSHLGWEDPELIKLLSRGGTVHRAWVVKWANGYPVREPNDLKVCKHCWRPIFESPSPHYEGQPWNLVYLEYSPPRWCDARNARYDGGTVIETIGHEPFEAPA